MSVLNALKTQEEPFECILPRKGSVDARPQRMEDGIEEPFAPSLGACAVAGILLDVRDHARIEHARAIVRGIKDRKSTRLNSSHSQISYAVFCLKKKKETPRCLHSHRPAATPPNLHLHVTQFFSGPLASLVALNHAHIPSHALDQTRAPESRLHQ